MICFPSSGADAFELSDVSWLSLVIKSSSLSSTAYGNNPQVSILRWSIASPGLHEGYANFGQFGFGQHLSTSRTVSNFTDHPHSQAMLRMLSDRRKFVRLILFQLSTHDTILRRWQIIDAYPVYQRRHLLIPYSRGVTHLSRHILYFSGNR